MVTPNRKIQSSVTEHHNMAFLFAKVRPCRSALLPSLYLASACAGPSYVHCRYYAKKKKPHKIELSEAEESIMGLDNIREGMSSVMNTLKWEYTNVVTAKLNPTMIGNLELKDRMVRIKEVAQIMMPNSQNVVINFSAQPSYIQDAVTLLRAKINLNPSIEGHVIKATLPKPSKEARERLSKDAKKCADEAKTRVRRVRQSAISTLRKQKDSVSKDSINKLENSIQKITDEHNELIDEMLKLKIRELQKQ